MIPQASFSADAKPKAEKGLYLLVGRVMDALFVNSVEPVAFSALTTPVPVIKAVAESLVPAGKAPGPHALTIQDLAQSLFQQSLQTPTLQRLTEPVSGSAGLAQDGVISLLATLNPALAPADTTLPVAPLANSEVVQAVTTSASSATSSAVPSPLPATNPQDGFTTSLDPDFAMQTALRFGAGVTIQAATSTGLPGPGGTGLVRDATAVLRMGNLQPHAGSPGPEAFTHPQASTRHALRAYESAPTLPFPQGAGSVDLVA